MTIAELHKELLRIELAREKDYQRILDSLIKLHSTMAEILEHMIEEAEKHDNDNPPSGR